MKEERRDEDDGREEDDEAGDDEAGGMHAVSAEERRDEDDGRREDDEAGGDEAGGIHTVFNLESISPPGIALTRPMCMGRCLRLLGICAASIAVLQLDTVARLGTRAAWLCTMAVIALIGSPWSPPKGAAPLLPAPTMQEESEMWQINGG